MMQIGKLVFPSSCVSLTLFLLTTFALGAGAEGYQPPRLADGSPDFQGIWRNATATPLERAPTLGTRRAFSEEEAAAIRAAALKRVADDAKPTDPDAPPPAAEPLPPVGNYNLFWTDRGMSVAQIDGEYRTSIIIDPPDGRIPDLTASARARMAERRGPERSDGPEGRSLGERCLLSFGSLSGPPMLPVMYNSHYQFVQTPGYVMILVEMVHDVRIIRIGEDLNHDPRRKWMGDSIGHWEGDTLVVRTTNFRPEQSFRGSSPDMVVTERFTRVADDKMVYRFTVDDPAAFEQPFTGELPFTAIDEQIFEYACHEGNYGLPGILAGARNEEALAKKAGE